MLWELQEYTGFSGLDYRSCRNRTLTIGGAADRNNTREEQVKESIELDELSKLVDTVLESLGLRKHERNIVFDVLLYAEMRGKSQGLVKILERTVVPDEERQAIGVQQSASCIHHLQANGNLGMVVLQEATDRAIAACQQHGLALSLTSGTSTSTGSIGYYAERIARAGLIALVMAGSPKVMALHAGSQRALGTNPIAFAVPTVSDPLVCDLATSAITWFDIIQLVRDDGRLPQGVALDAQGRPTDSPAAALEGVLLPFAGSKGSALALMVECLTGPLSGANVLGDSGDSRGNFVLAIDPAAVLPGGHDNDVKSEFSVRMSLMLERMQEEVDGNFRLPGQRSRELARACEISSSVAIDCGVLEELRGLAKTGSKGTSNRS